MMVDITKDEMDLLIKSHKSAQKEGAAEGDAIDERHREARAAHLMDIGGYSEPPA